MQAQQSIRVAINKERQANLKAILTPEQWTKWEAYQKEQQQKRQKK